ncbi:DUF2878 domain-containing protein [Microbulbifer sp. GL-2]|uniref:DUF2878 domain-containing protein n=1 Tax=Microbulbifer sp. GL-2 TaxID=2591606 RepID=UPI00117E17A2|nr:DUF2878 domain-containing protein [Microbulbifer sp. GL-2]
MWRFFANAILFDIAWPVCVIIARPWVVVPFTLASLGFHLIFVANLRSEPLWLAGIFLFGVGVDSVLFHLGVLQNLSGSSWPPIWLICLWLNFAMTLRYSLVLLQRNLWLATLLGGIFGPFSYYTGALLNGTVELHRPLWQSILVLSVLWAVMLPAFLRLARALNTTSR